MPKEIERKFRVVSGAWRDQAKRSRKLVQAYVADTEKCVVRVRIEDDARAVLTIKSRGTHLSRDEFEYPIPLEDARILLESRQGAILEKTRYDVDYDSFVWEIDVYAGENEGLVIAEVELRSEADEPPIPAFVGAEVTGQTRYYASELARRPYSEWSPADRA
jgi:CYTH domain-containing protein